MDEQRKNVIKGLEWALKNMVDPFNDFRFAGYDGPIVLLNEPIVRDALALLKAQEPVKPVIDKTTSFWTLWRCGTCGTTLIATDRFCGKCGRAVKWE